MQFMRDWIVQNANKAGLYVRIEVMFKGIAMDILYEEVPSSELLAQIYIPYHNNLGIILPKKTKRTNLPDVIIVNWYDIGLSSDNASITFESYKQSLLGAGNLNYSFNLKIDKNGCVGIGTAKGVNIPPEKKNIKDLIPTEKNPERLKTIFLSGSLSTEYSISHRRRIIRTLEENFPSVIPVSLNDVAKFNANSSYKEISDADMIVVYIADNISPWVENEYKFAKEFQRKCKVLINRPLVNDETKVLIEAKFGLEDILEYDSESLESIISGIVDDLTDKNDLKYKTSALNVFISYSHKDETFKDKLDIALSALKRSNKISTWNDRKIIPGTEWDSKIKKELESADLILLLISADFLASDYIWEVEIKKAIEKHEKGEATVIPIFCRACDFENMPFAKIQGLPKDAMPLDSFSSIDEGLASVAKGIRAVIDKKI